METLTTRSFLAEQPEAGQDAAPAAVFALSYNSKAITDSVAPHLLAFTYTDKTDGEADELEVVLEDSVGNWRAQWYPEKGATLQASLGFPGAVLNCGKFEIDEVGQTLRPNVVTLRALATGISKTALRTKRSKAHESQTLRQIAEKVAATYGLSILGEIRPITILRNTQHNATDLAHLKKLALDYGHVFSIRGKQMVFTDVYKLEGSKPVATLQLKDISGGEFNDKLTGTFKDAKVKYHNPKTGKVVSGHHEAVAGADTAADTLKLHHKAEDQAQADAQARAALHRHNSRATTGRLSMSGRPELVAGVTVRLDSDGVEFGKVGGLYYVETSTHHASRADGYTTEISIKRIAK